MWLKTSEGQWINTEHIVRIYLFDVHQTARFGNMAPDKVIGRKALLDLDNGHTVPLAYFPDQGDLERQTAQFAETLQAGLMQDEPITDFAALGYLPLPPETV
jgi:hypothetical protein